MKDKKRQDVNSAALLASLSLLFLVLGAPLMNASKVAGVGSLIGGSVLIGLAGYEYSKKPKQ